MVVLPDSEHFFLKLEIVLNNNYTTYTRCMYILEVPLLGCGQQLTIEFLFLFVGNYFGR